MAARAGASSSPRVGLEPALLEPVAYIVRDAEGQASLDRSLLTRELARRLHLLDRLEHDVEAQEVMRAMIRLSPEPLFDHFLYGFDPREKLYLPLALWPKQREFLRWLDDCIRTGQENLIEKSRDAGITYMTAGMALRFWLTEPGFKTTFCANKLDNVDELGNPDSIFEKMRIMLTRLPGWLRPENYNPRLHEMRAKMINPQNGNVIVGEGGKEAGRGGRSTWYVVDEAAFVENAEAVNAATSANAKVRTWASTVNRPGDFFASHRDEEGVRVFTLHWSDDPRKDAAWRRKKRAEIGAQTFAREYDIDYDAAVSGLIIPRPWVKAAVELFKRFGDGPGLAFDPIASLDVGVMRDFSSLVVRRGPVIYKPRTQRDPDTVNTAHWALALAIGAGATRMNYDSVGVGAGVSSTLKRSTRDHRVRVVPLNTGTPASSYRMWPDKQRSKDKFRNLRAELWWLMRERCKNSYVLWRHIEGIVEEEEIGGEVFERDDAPPEIETCALIEPHAKLERELSLLRWDRTERGQILVESKADLRARNMKQSPDHADAAIGTLYEEGIVDFAGGSMMTGGRLTSADLVW